MLQGTKVLFLTRSNIFRKRNVGTDFGSNIIINSVKLFSHDTHTQGTYVV